MKWGPLKRAFSILVINYVIGSFSWSLYGLFTYVKVDIRTYIRVRIRVDYKQFLTSEVLEIKTTLNQILFLSLQKVTSPFGIKDVA